MDTYVVHALKGLACRTHVEVTKSMIFFNGSKAYESVPHGMTSLLVCTESIESAGYDRDGLLSLLQRRACDLNDVQRRAQLLLRAYGSDDGVAFRRIASSYITPVVGTVQELSEALTVINQDMYERGDVEYSADVFLQASGLMADIGLVQLVCVCVRVCVCVCGRGVAI